MYMALAARPLPKWFHLILSVLLFNLSCAIVYVYIMTRNITSSTERFEAMPSYVVAFLFFASGCLSLAMTKSVISENLRVAQAGVILSLVTITISMAAIICTLWLADIQDKFVMCLYNAQNLQCLCRNDNVTDARDDDDWYVYERVSGCNRLDSLNRCMIASIALDAIGAFICFLAFSNFGLIWVRNKLESRRGNTAFNVDGNSSLGGRNGIGGPTGAETVNSYGSSATSSPAGTPGSHSDWDGWLFSHPFFRQMFSEFRHMWFPPTYEQSQTASAVPVQDAAARVESPSPSVPSPPTSGSVLTAALGDYPPPPYSKTPQRKYGTITPKRSEPAAAPNTTNAPTSRPVSQISEHMTAT